MDINSSTINYLRQCYEADAQQGAVWNIFGSSFEDRLVIEGKEEVLTGDLPQVLLEKPIAEALLQKSIAYAKEKSLVYASLMIVGRLPKKGLKSSLICAPLYLFESKVVKETTKPPVPARLIVNESKYKLNTGMLDAISENDATPIYLGLERFFEDAAFSEEEAFDLADLFKDYAPELDCSAFENYPTLMSEDEIKNILAEAGKKKKLWLKLVPFSALGLIKHSQSRRGVLNELTELSNWASPNFSAPLQALFQHDKKWAVDSTKNKHFDYHLPAILSKAQQDVLAASFKNPLTMVVGPPGTGKSYTIAALAMAHVSNRQKVLIVSRMDHAVDVIGDKIESQLGIKGITFRAGRGHYLSKLKKHLENVLAGLVVSRDSIALAETYHGLQRKLKSLDKRIQSLEKQLTKRYTTEIAWGENFAKRKHNIFRKAISGFDQWREKDFKLLQDISAELTRLTVLRITKVRELIQAGYEYRLSDSLLRNRKHIKDFLDTFRSRTMSTMESRHKKLSHSAILDVFPIWLVSLSDLHRAIPQYWQMFDLVIIDEASQVDTATPIPALQRAKRAVIVGDPKQLRHVSFLSNRKQVQFADNAELAKPVDFRNTSILDWTSDSLLSQENLVFLDEHFRSRPDIIAFSNKHFYADKLKLMTRRPFVDDQLGLALDNTFCAGRRIKVGYNKIEAEKLVEDVVTLVKSEAKLPESDISDIGILSPFRAQVDFLYKLLSKKVSGADFQRHNINIGTAHAFQGEERDVMFISMVVDGNAPGARRFLEKEDVFNVAITRAKLKQRIYTSVKAENLPENSLLRKYLDYIDGLEHKVATPAGGNHQHDEFLAEVQEKLQSAGVQIQAAWPIAGMTLDLMVWHENKLCGIDLVGCPGDFADAFPIERYQILARAGVPIVPISWLRWQHEAEACLKPVLALVGV